MAEYLIQDTTLTEIGNAIRSKTGGTDPIPVSEMASTINTLKTTGWLEDVATEAEMNALLVAENIGKAYRFTGESTTTYAKGDVYIVEESE